MDPLADALLIVVFGAVIARQLSGRGPPVWIVFGVGGLATVALGVLPVPDLPAVGASAAPILLFLFALFVLARALEQSGALDHIGRWLVARARRPENLPPVLLVGFAVASAFLLNDALVLVGVPLLLAVARRHRLPAIPLMLTLAFSVTLGSVPTPFGNPQNLLVALASGLTDPVQTFLRYLLLPTVLGVAFGAWYVRRVFRAQFRGVEWPSEPEGERTVRLIPRGIPRATWRRHPVLVVFPATMGVLVGVSLLAPFDPSLDVPTWAIALAGALLVLLLSSDRGLVARRVNGSILVLFAGLFLVVGGAVDSGVIGALDILLPLPGPTHAATGLGTIVASSVLGSQIVSNVPWVAFQIPIYASRGYGAATPVAWAALAGASTLAGNVTLLGAASNLIVVELAEKEGVHLRLADFFRYALPLAAVTLAILFLALLAGV
jgi:Na+/H+ antiporter NhaD/arsenite permease-like protein